MTDHGQVYDYPSTVGIEINDDRPDDYVRAAEYLNSGGFEAVSLQHEFGIFGGEAGSQIMTLLSRLTIQDKASMLAHAAVIHNDLKTADGEFDIFQRTTAADVQRVARTYFTPATRTIITILPRTAAPTAEASR